MTNPFGASLTRTRKAQAPEDGPRLSVLLDRDRNRRLALFALEADSPKVHVIRVLLDCLADDPELQKVVVRHLAAGRGA